MIVRDRETKQSKGLAYITFGSPFDAAIAYEECDQGMCYCTRALLTKLSLKSFSIVTYSILFISMDISISPLFIDFLIDYAHCVSSRYDICLIPDYKPKFAQPYAKKRQYDEYEDRSERRDERYDRRDRHSERPRYDRMDIKREPVSPAAKNGKCSLM